MDTNSLKTETALQNSRLGRRRIKVTNLYVAVGLLAVGLYFLVPANLARYTYDAFSIVAAIVVAMATRLYRPTASFPWYLIAAGQFLFAVGDITYAIYLEVLKSDAFPGLYDLFYLSAYPFVTAGVFIIIRRRNPHDNRATVLDPLLVTTGVGMLSWIWLVEPYVSNGSMSMFARLVSAGYPLMDLLLLLAALRLTMGSGRNSPSLYLISASFLIHFLTDTVYFLLLNAGSYYAGHPIDAGWLFAYVLVGAAAIHPSMCTLAEPVPKESKDQVLLGRRRLILLLAGALLGPLVLAFQAVSNVPLDVPVVLLGSVIMFTIVLLRMAIMMGEQTQAYQRLSENKEALQLAQSKLKLLAENVADPIYAYNMDRKLLYVNPAVEKLTGYTPAELYLEPFINWAHPEDQARIEQVWEDLWRGGSCNGLEYRLITKSGELKWCEATWGPMLDESGNRVGVQGVDRDITERKQAEAVLKEKEAAEVANRAKSEFLSRMSHELRTPLNAILGFGQLLEMDDLDDTQAESVQLILKAGHHLLGLVNEVLDISSIEAGQLSLSSEPVPMLQVVEETIDMVRSMAAQRDIRLDLQIPKVYNRVHVAADRRRLKQVILNLLANAVKYNCHGGRVIVTFELLTSDGTMVRSESNDVQQTGAHLRMNVSDTGSGIPPEKLPRLFTAFDRLGAEQSEVEGTGLGLAVSKQLMEVMGGTIAVRSMPGQGSVFSVELPIVEGTAENDERNSTKSLVVTETEAPAQTHTLLCIQENLSNLTLAEHVVAH